MNALTRISADTPVKFDVMNKLEAEIEARDIDLQEQINDCLKESIATKTTTATKIADISECGIYGIVNGGSQFTDYPSKLINDGLLYGELIVSKNNYLTYELTVFNGNYGNTTKMCGVKNNNTMLIDWEQIATTEKANITLLNGWSNLDGGTTTIMTAYKTGNLVFISGILQTGTKTENTVIGVLPVGFKPSKLIKQTQNQYSTPNQFTGCAFNVDIGGNVYINGVTQSYILLNITIPIE